MNNKRYNQLAEEYNSKYFNERCIKHQSKVLKPFKDLFKKDSKIIDIGCGIGLDTYVLSKCFKVTGIDLCSEMIKYARQNNPKSKFIQMDFLRDEVKGRYDGVLMDAFFHLFSKKQVSHILNKVKSIMLPNSYGLICTTEHKKTREGFYQKKDYSNPIIRFRRFYTGEEIVKVISDNGFDIVKVYRDKSNNKKWINIIFKLGDKK